MQITTLGDILTDRAKRYGKKKYITFNKATYTYADIEAKANQISRYMHTIGVKQGDKVAMMLENSPEFICCLFAIVKLGAILVPVNTFLKQEEVRYITNNCEAQVVISSKKFEPIIKDILKTSKVIKHILTFTSDITEFDFVNINEEIPRYSKRPIDVIVESNALAVIIYTSGTTGEPKGAMLSHANLISCVEMASKLYPMKDKDRYLLFLPMFHIYSLEVCIIWPTFLGASIIILESVMDLKKKSFRSILIFKRPTVMVAVPTVYSALAKAKIPAWFIKFLYPVKFHLSSGSGLPLEVFNEFKKTYKAEIIEGYGLSETSPVVAGNRIGSPKPGSVGKPLSDDVKVIILDDDEKEVPLGEVGEIVVKGPNVMRGYYKMPTETAEVLKNGWFHTGDLGYIDKNDGNISIVDRKKDLILVKGMNVYPREVEEVLYKVGGVEACAVIGVPEPDGDEVIIAYIKKVADALLSEKDIKSYLKKHLANFKIPKHIYFSDELPLTTIGKVLKRKLKEMVMKGELKISST